MSAVKFSNASTALGALNGKGTGRLHATARKTGHPRLPNGGSAGAFSPLEMADKTAGILGWFPFIASGVAMVGNGVSKVGGWVGLAPVTKIGNAISAPAKFVNEKTIAEIPVSGAVVRATDSAFSALATGVEAFSDATGLGANRAASNLSAADKFLWRTQKKLATVDRSGITAEFSPHLDNIHAAVSNAATIDHLNLDALRSSVEEAQKFSQEGGKFAKGFWANRKAKKLIHAADGIVAHHDTAKAWSNIGDTVRATPQKIGEATISHGIMNAAFIGMSGISVVSDTKKAASDWDTLKEMYADLTGKDTRDVSNMMLLGTVPPAVAAARSHLIKNFAVKQLADVANIAINIKQIIDHRFGVGKAMGAMGATMAVSMGTDAILGGSILPAYKTLKDAQENGEELTLDAYAGFLAIASKELKARGADNRFTQEIAKQYLQEKATPADVLKEVGNGKLTARIAVLIHSNELARSTQDAVDTQTVKSARQKKERAIVGPHTQGIISRDSKISNIEQGAAPAVS